MPPNVLKENLSLRPIDSKIKLLRIVARSLPPLSEMARQLQVEALKLEVQSTPSTPPTST